MQKGTGTDHVQEQLATTPGTSCDSCGVGEKDRRAVSLRGEAAGCAVYGLSLFCFHFFLLRRAACKARWEGRVSAKSYHPPKNRDVARSRYNPHRFVYGCTYE